MYSAAKVLIKSCSSFSYPHPPFNPPVVFPEFSGVVVNTDPANIVYDAVRDSFVLMGYDKENFGTTNWNPLGFLVSPGERVFVKPNMISQKHRFNDDWDYVITNGSFVRVIVDYLFIAMKGKGTVMIGDAPQTDSKYWEIVKLMGLKEIQAIYSKYPEFNIELLNLQDEYWVTKDDIYADTIPLPGDVRGSMLFDLGKESFFSEYDSKNVTYYGAHYDTSETNLAHSNGHHKYAIARSPLIADVFINIPKLKTHKKCGITVNLKSLVGINANKNLLPHYIYGAPETGGDQFPKDNSKGKIENTVVGYFKKLLLKKGNTSQFLARKTKRLGYMFLGDTEKVVRSGNWSGNDTVWRMSLDLNRILLYGNTEGSFRETSGKKRFFSVVDGIVSMEGNGPVAGTRKETGIVIMGTDPVVVDSVCARVMGFDLSKIKLIKRAFDHGKYPLTNTTLDEVECVSNEEKWNKPLKEFSYHDSFKFIPHFGWTEIIDCAK